MNVIPLWTKEINLSLENQIMSCFNETFSQTKHGNYFQWKFHDNPFGESLHIIVMDRDKVVGARAFWRLDIDGVEAYQCVDTSFLPEYQGKGLFKKTTIEALKLLNGRLIYNYPNALSGPAYIKYGWKAVKGSTSIKVNFTRAMLDSAPVINWDSDTLKWRFQRNPEASYYSYKKGKFYYLFSAKRKNLFVLLGKTQTNLGLASISPFICFSYDKASVGLPFHSKLPYMSKGAEKYALHTFLFDMA